MLTSIGKKSKSFFVKILVGIIILPFVFWGMGDVFRGGNQNIIASINSKKISTQEFMNYLNRINLSELQMKELKNSNLFEEILSEYIGMKIILLEIEDYKVKVTDKSLKNIITSDKEFFKNGKFSRTKYEKFILTSNTTHSAFEKNLKNQEQKRQLLNFLSNGLVIPEFLIENEFNKENQIKSIKYIDLNKFYNKKKFEKKEIQEIYTKNKDLFVEEYKEISFAELTPLNLIGTIEFDKTYFAKIDEIENDILDGKKLEDLAKNNNFQLINTGSININKLDINGNKFDKINDKLFNKIFNIKEINTAEVLNIDNKYYVGKLNSKVTKNLKLENKEVQEAIINQLKIKNKLENNTKIVKEISEGKFNKNYMENFAKKNDLIITNKIINSLKDNEIFSEGLIKRIFLTKNNEINLITDSKLSKNFIIFTKKSQLKKLNKQSDDYKKYKLKAKFNFRQEIFKTYDKSLNKKYKIEQNSKVINRIKNSF
ncbi:MAG: SurA N-terminal domain-containing protein [Pelagibacteraceae bacterium]